MEMDPIYRVLDFIDHYIYSRYIVVLFIGSGLLSFFIDTEHAYLFDNNKDYVISFFLGILNIILGIILIVINLLHARYVF